MMDKIGKMAPNIQVLSLRRMKFITNPVFAQIFKYMHSIERIDLTDCLGLLSSATCLLVDHNRKLSHVQLSGCTDGVNNEVMSNIANYLTQLNFLDISYCKQVTDEGLAHFTGKTYPLDSLSINGCNGISGPGLKLLLNSFKDTLLDLEAALNDQQIFNSCFMETLGFCLNLETLDLGGSNDINDEGFRQLANAQITVGSETVKPGLANCHTLKLSGATITDGVMTWITKSLPNLEHVEIIKCDAIGEFGLQQFLQNCPNLSFIDIASLPIINYAFLDQLKQTNPDLLIRRTVH